MKAAKKNFFQKQNTKKYKSLKKKLHTLSFVRTENSEILRF